ncbi:hypothetical protein NQ315_016570 [Exocentrus adspersus]|uniref:Fatty acyl-CoA reductase n=1 Tax=Exocentrus adspersus TaxID=1586481 RepID=A0AAV8VZH6_9CUCU|nr:hypothetical protein NQ315_016570 [Exocentrus adspersus]
MTFSDTVNPNSPENLTPTQKFFFGSKMLVTGGTGFIGHVLLEKLLTACPNISKIYLIIRRKKDTDIEVRLDRMLEDVVFSKLRVQCPDFRDKIVAVEGDMQLPDLGLNPSDRLLLRNEMPNEHENVFTFFPCTLPASNSDPQHTGL